MSFHRTFDSHKRVRKPNKIQENRFQLESREDVLIREISNRADEIERTMVAWQRAELIAKLVLVQDELGRVQRLRRISSRRD